MGHYSGFEIKKNCKVVQSMRLGVKSYLKTGKLILNSYGWLL